MKIPSRIRLSHTVPGLTLLLLLVLPIVVPNRTIVDAAAVAHQKAVALAVEQAPYRIGQWVGRDMAVPPAAIRLLRPNAILSRRFRRIGEDWTLDVLLVHCTDARDMRGHFPPICYPFAGWEAMPPRAGRESELMVAGQPMPVRIYEFRRVEDGIREARIRICNTFILPDGTITTDIRQINRLTERLALAATGIAQLQIVSRSDVDEERIARAADEILTGMPKLLTELRLTDGGDNVRDQR